MTRTALITGASRGIGREIAIHLARRGCRVVLSFRERHADAEQVVARIHQEGGQAWAVQADLAVPLDASRLADSARQCLGAPVDILINNAGVLRRGDVEDFDYSQMEGMRAVNVDGLVRVTREVIPFMKDRRWGRIVNITSIAALGTSFAGTTFYAATKAAVITLTRRFALDLGPFGITVNAVAPGFILTGMSAGSGHAIEAAASRAMMRRAGQPEDIANAVSFLVSQESSFITAQVLTVDGGRTDYIAHP